MQSRVICWTLASHMWPSCINFSQTMPPERNSRGVLQASKESRSLLVVTDFGTTFSKVAYCQRGGLRPEIITVKNYPGDPRPYPHTPSSQVPTESWYAEVRKGGDSSVSAWSDERTGTSRQAGIDDDKMEFELEFANQGHNTGILWGYEVQDLVRPDADLRTYNKIALPKLMLDTSENTQPVRDDLAPILQRLKEQGIITYNEDVITDYLTELLLHTKWQLEAEDKLSALTVVEHVLTVPVPVVWGSKPMRMMQNSMETAIKRSQFGSIEGLFFVSEPEAAATFVIAKNRDGSNVNPGEVFLMLDAGGGTCDAGVYMLKQENPIRLSEGLVDQEGCLNGSSFLNADFRRHLYDRLKDHKSEIEQNDATLESIVEFAVLAFETRLKRNVDTTARRMKPELIYVPGLKENAVKRFRRNQVEMHLDDFKNIFDPHLEAIGELMERQLKRAQDSGSPVRKVVLIGGFSASTSLRKTLSKRLKRISDDIGHQVRLTKSMDWGEPEIAVAYGAALRALDKENGPDRVTRSSFGFLRHEQYDPDLEEFDAIEPTISQVDNGSYVFDTILWLLKKGDRVDAQQEYSIRSIHAFSDTEKEWMCREVMFVSDTSTESRYQVTHEKNRGAEIAGSVEVDMSFLLKEQRIKPIEVHYDTDTDTDTDTDEEYGDEPDRPKKLFYQVEFDLVMIVDGRNIRFEARMADTGEVQGKGQICIAAAFVPGVK